MGTPGLGPQCRLNPVLRDKQHIASATIIEEPHDVDNNEEIAEEKAFFAF